MTTPGKSLGTGPLRSGPDDCQEAHEGDAAGWHKESTLAEGQALPAQSRGYHNPASVPPHPPMEPHVLDTGCHCSGPSFPS